MFSEGALHSKAKELRALIARNYKPKGNQELRRWNRTRKSPVSGKIYSSFGDNGMVLAKLGRTSKHT